ncbi:MAG TPA: hypothetical protein VG826_29235 [Pirellulales bacterium]|nr:hypothetical protein [Pirellulales bacterium]
MGHRKLSLLGILKRTPLPRWPLWVVAAGVGLYAANHWIEQLPPNTDVAGLIVSALGVLAGVVGKGQDEVRGELREIKEIWERFGAQGQRHADLAGAVAANKTACDQVARSVSRLSTHVVAHHRFLVTDPGYQPPDVPLPAT